MNQIDMRSSSTRELNSRLHRLAGKNDLNWKITHPNGKHALAVGLSEAASIIIEGHVGYYCAGMNKNASITINGNAGPALAENIMSGTIRVKGNASQYAAASGHGGLVVIEGDASARCGISMKGVDIVVGGSVGHMSAFMAQAGHLVVCGDAGHHLGDSIYEATIFVRGKVASLGADCIAKEMDDDHLGILQNLLSEAGIAADPDHFTRYGSARNLYHFKVDHANAY